MFQAAITAPGLILGYAMAVEYVSTDKKFVEWMQKTQTKFKDHPYMKDQLDIWWQDEQNMMNEINHEIRSTNLKEE